MVYLSKSKYCGLWQCPKIAWLRKYKPETSRLDDSVLARMEAGNEVGALVRSLYGDFVDITAYTGENPDLKKMMENTSREMEKGTPVICEASFEYNGLYCAVDILRKDGDGWAIYEVKSSSKHGGDSDDKPVYRPPVRFHRENGWSTSDTIPLRRGRQWYRLAGHFFRFRHRLYHRAFPGNIAHNTAGKWAVWR